MNRWIHHWGPPLVPRGPTDSGQALLIAGLLIRPGRRPWRIKISRQARSSRCGRRTTSNGG